jgi:hypothetical protein
MLGHFHRLKTMNEVTTHALAFLLGTATGAAGTYFAEKYTDKRRKKETISEEDAFFQQLGKRMPDLFAEMQSDLLVDGHSEWREFFVVRKGAQLWASENSFIYEDDGSNAYLSKTRILEEHGYLVEITPGNAPMFRMRDSFVAKLLKWKKA